MKNPALFQALIQFTAAVKKAVHKESKEALIDHLGKTSPADLQQILTACEEIEEYEICDILVKAMNQRQNIAA